MAIRKKEFQKSKSKKPSYERTSKMRRYDIIFDRDIEQMRVGFFKRISSKIKFDKRDTIFTVDAAHQNRIDLISLKFYGTAKYDWIIEDFNNIQDPIKDIVPGRKLVIPEKSKIYSIT